MHIFLYDLKKIDDVENIQYLHTEGVYAKKFFFQKFTKHIGANSAQNIL